MKITDLSTARVLEVGPGYGDLAHLLHGRARSLDLMDVVPDYLDVIRQQLGVSTLVADIQNYESEMKYDLIIMTDVLEHLLRPSDALIRAFRSLRPGGYIYVRVPANEALMAYSTTLGCPYEAVHLRTFTKGLLNLELKSAGFDLASSARGLRGGDRVPRFGGRAGRTYWHARRSQVSQAWSGNEVSSLPGAARAYYFLVSGERPKSLPKPFGVLFSLVSQVMGTPAEIWAVGQRPC